MSQQRTRIFSGLSVLITAVALLLTATPGAVAGAGAGRPGAPGLGDYLFPGLGNGGYDAKDYTLRLRYPTVAGSKSGRGHNTETRGHRVMQPASAPRPGMFRPVIDPKAAARPVPRTQVTVRA